MVCEPPDLARAEHPNKHAVVVHHPQGTESPANHRPEGIRSGLVERAGLHVLEANLCEIEKTKLLSGDSSPLEEKQIARTLSSPIFFCK